MKILFVSFDLSIGGIQKALVSLIKKTVEQNPNYQIDLLLFSKYGEYLKEVPPQVNIIQVKSRMLRASVTAYDRIKKEGSFSDKLAKILSFLLIKILGHQKFYSLIVGKKKSYKDYDLAIAYSHDNYMTTFMKGANLFVLNRVEAKEKHAYLHADISKETVNIKHMEKIYAGFDKIIAVSKGCQDILNKAIPSLMEKTSYEHNVVDAQEIKLLAQENIPFGRQEGIKYFVTVSRLSYHKGIDRVLNIVEKLVNKNITNFKWHIVGEGQAEYKSEILNAQVKEKALDKYLFFTGNQENPFPFVKQSDIFIMPSRAESFSLVIVEAIALDKLVITCDYSAAKELLEHTNNIIVENSEVALQKAIEQELIKE